MTTTETPKPSRAPTAPKAVLRLNADELDVVWVTMEEAYRMVCRQPRSEERRKAKMLIRGVLLRVERGKDQLEAGGVAGG